MKFVQFVEYGGPDVLRVCEGERPKPTGRQVLIEAEAIGVNYADTARREGRYVVPTPLPFIPGTEVAGVVCEVGPEVQTVRPGQRVVALIESGATPSVSLLTSGRSCRFRTAWMPGRRRLCRCKG